jgi:hypothetical protein
MQVWRSPRLVLAAASLLACLGIVHGADKSPGEMASSATTFLAGLSAEQRRQAAFPFEGPERLHWHFIPTEMFPRKGLPITAMSPSQRQLAHGLLRAGLSQRGYLTATAIMDLETLLGALEAAEGSSGIPGRPGELLVRNPEGYFFSVFGTPSPRGAWGWRVEGHHVSLNFTVVNGAFVAATPSFFGSNPAQVREGPKKGLRILAAEEDSARALLAALDASQRAKAITAAAAPDDIQTMSALKVDPLSPAGIAARELTPIQRELLLKVIDAYGSAMAPDVAADRMAKITKAGVEKIAFAWAGETERGRRHYYRVQGPTFLIEYDNTQNDANHIHSVWRDFEGDFGRDLLREHLKAAAH